MTAQEVSPRFVLTGPSGWIGQAMLVTLARLLGGRLDGRVLAFASSARVMDLPGGEQLAVRALSDVVPADVAGAHVIHLAYLTKEKADQLGERAFMDANLGIDDTLMAALDSAAEPPASLFVASSGAAALTAQGRDLHPYGVAKLRQEARFLAWGVQADVPVLAGRIFNVAGPYINKLESYALSNFALQARAAGEIVVQAPVPTFRSFLHIDDLCGLVVGAALQRVGRPAPIDLCGAQVVEMEDLADAVAAAIEELHGDRIPVRRSTPDCTRSSQYLGNFADTKVLAMQLRVAFSSLGRQVSDTIEWLDNCNISGHRAETSGAIATEP